MSTNPESAAVEAAAWQLIGEDGEPAFVPYTRHEDALAMVAFYQDDKWLQPRDQEVFTIRELYPQSALDALRGEVERLGAIESAARTYYREYCQDEAGDEPDDNGRGMWTGASAKQINDAAALRDALTKESP